LAIRPVKTEWSGTGVVICLQQGANHLHMVQLMPLPTHQLLLYLYGAGLPGCPGKKAIEQMQK